MTVRQIDREFRVGWKILLIALLGVVTSPHYLGLYSFGPLVQDLKSAVDIPIGELQRAITFNFVFRFEGPKSRYLFPLGNSESGRCAAHRTLF